MIRGARVVELLADTSLGVRVREEASGERVYHARLLVGADGRNSMCRGWRGFHPKCDPDGMILAGLLVDGLAAPEDTMSSFIHPRLGTVSLAVPLGKGRFRLYVGRHKRDGAPKERAWSGNNSVDAFSSASVAAGARPLGMPAISAPLVRWPRSMPPTAGSSIPTVGDNEGSQRHAGDTRPPVRSMVLQSLTTLGTPADSPSPMANYANHTRQS